MKCKYCGFDPSIDSLVSEGAPCGYSGCLIHTCCMESWEEHMEKAHGIVATRWRDQWILLHPDIQSSAPIAKKEVLK